MLLTHPMIHLLLVFITPKYEARVSRFGRENGGGTKFDKSNNKASSSNDSLVATKGVEDEGMESFSNLSEASGNTSLTLLADKIRDIESLMLEVKLIRREKDAKRVENVTTMTNIATPIDVGPQANDKQTHTLPTKSKDGKHTPTWKETLDDDYDPYDDDVYNANCLSEDQEALCNALDIKFCGCMKKWIIFGVVLSQMLSAMHLEDRPLKFSAITYYSNVTWCLGALGSDAWYLEVAKPFLVDPNVVDQGENCWVYTSI
ncbi:hypothetical protein Tco_1008771 [Tanacetum coccineum]